MWFGCRLPVAVVSQTYPGNAEICPGILPPQAVLRIILSNEGDQVAYESYKLLRWRSMHRQTCQEITSGLILQQRCYPAYIVAMATLCRWKVGID